MSGGLGRIGKTIQSMFSQSASKSAKQSEKDTKIQDLRKTYLNKESLLQKLSDQKDQRMQDIKGQQDVLRLHLKELNQKRMELKNELKKEVRDSEQISKLRGELSNLIVEGKALSTKIKHQNLYTSGDSLTGLAGIKEKIALKKTNSLLKKTTEKASDEGDIKQAKRQMSIAALREKIGIGSSKQLRVAARTLEHESLGSNYKHKKLLETSKYRDNVASSLAKFNDENSLINQRELTDAMEFLPANDKMRMKAYDALNAPQVKAQRESDVNSVIKSLSKTIETEDVQKLANLIDISNRLGNLKEKRTLLLFLGENLDKLKDGQSEELQDKLDRLSVLSVPTQQQIESKDHLDTIYKDVLG